MSIQKQFIHMDEKILILGLGNILMGDEGIGVKSVEFMKDKT